MSRDSEKSLKKHPQSAILAGDMSRFLDFYKAKIAEILLSIYFLVWILNDDFVQKFQLNRCEVAENLKKLKIYRLFYLNET